MNLKKSHSEQCIVEDSQENYKSNTNETIKDEDKLYKWKRWNSIDNITWAGQSSRREIQNGTSDSIYQKTQAEKIKGRNVEEMVFLRCIHETMGTNTSMFPDT